MSIVTLSIPIKNPNFKYNIKFENICKFSIDKFMILFYLNAYFKNNYVIYFLMIR